MDGPTGSVSGKNNSMPKCFETAIAFAGVAHLKLNVEQLCTPFPFCSRRQLQLKIARSHHLAPHVVYNFHTSSLISGTQMPSRRE